MCVSTPRSVIDVFCDGNSTPDCVFPCHVRAVKVLSHPGDSASRASAPSIAPERHRPVERPRAPPRSMPCHRRWVQAGSGRDSTMFLSCGITAGDGSHRVPLTAETRKCKKTRSHKKADATEPSSPTAVAARGRPDGARACLWERVDHPRRREDKTSPAACPCMT